MATILNYPHRLFKVSEVDAVAAMMQANDDDWTYRVKHDPTGKGLSLIEIYDEDGLFVGRVS